MKISKLDAYEICNIISKLWKLLAIQVSSRGTILKLCFSSPFQVFCSCLTLLTKLTIKNQLSERTGCFSNSFTDKIEKIQMWEMGGNSLLKREIIRTKFTQFINFLLKWHDCFLLYIFRFHIFSFVEKLIHQPIRLVFQPTIRLNWSC